ncbi:MAG: galactose-1-phosphate uridylyltransferase [Candidatus Aminicenantia bacterium]
MPEIRQNFITKEWVIFAPERSKRPEDFKSKKEKKEFPSYLPECPFCRGNEHLTPPEVYSIKKNGEWFVRVVPNKFSALQREGEKIRSLKGIKRSITGVGIHEVIIETPSHNHFIPFMSQEEVMMVLEAYKVRHIEALKDPNIEMVLIFKNHGERAGTSLEHPHSQLIGLPIIPTDIRQRLWDAMRYYDETGECIYCRNLKEELSDRERIVLETENFVVFIPYAAYSPFHTWIFPKIHRCSFLDTGKEELKELSQVLKTILLKLYKGLKDPDYNILLRSFPSGKGADRFFHWYVSIVLRITQSAGFELGTGMFINTSLPERDAYFLRNVEI